MKSMILIALMLLVSVGVYAQDFRDKRVVSVEGVAEAFVAPDRASVTLGVETEGKDAKLVKSDNDKRVRLLISSLTKLGIEMKDIQTSTLRLDPVYNYRPEGKREFIKFTMRNMVHITIRDLQKLDEVVSLSVESGGNVLDEVSFSVSNSKQLTDSLRIEAAKDAKRKAEQLAIAVGVRIGKPLSISESGNYQPPVPMYKARGMMAMEADGAPTISTGTMMMRSTVNATFELE